MGDDSLEKAARHGHLNVIKWLCLTFRLTIIDVKDSSCFSQAARGGHLNILLWLHKTCKYTEEDVKQCENITFCMAVYGSCLLPSRFSVRVGEARSNESGSFAVKDSRSKSDPLYFSHGARLGTLRWLCYTFNITDKDIGENSHHIIETLVGSSWTWRPTSPVKVRIETLEWLHNTFNLMADSVYIFAAEMLTEDLIITRNSPEMLEYLISTFSR